MKLVKVMTSDLWLILCMTEGKEFHYKCIKGLPDGAIFVYMFQDSTFNVGMIFSHDSFKELELGEEIPEFRVEFHKLYCKDIKE